MNQFFILFFMLNVGGVFASIYIVHHMMRVEIVNTWVRITYIVVEENVQ